MGRRDLGGGPGLPVLALRREAGGGPDHRPGEARHGERFLAGPPAEVLARLEPAGVAPGLRGRRRGGERVPGRRAARRADRLRPAGGARRRHPALPGDRAGALAEAPGAPRLAERPGAAPLRGAGAGAPPRGGERGAARLLLQHRAAVAGALVLEAVGQEEVVDRGRARRRRRSPRRRAAPPRRRWDRA